MGGESTFEGVGEAGVLMRYASFERAATSGAVASASIRADRPCITTFALLAPLLDEWQFGINVVNFIQRIPVVLLGLYSQRRTPLLSRAYI